MTTLYLVDTHNPSGYAQVLEEFTIAGGATNLSSTYTYGRSLISRRQPGVVTNFYVVDGHGSVRLLLSPTGAITDSYAYDAFGNVLANNGSTANNYRYCGEQYDPDLSTYYLRAPRYFDVTIGRFQTFDSHEGDLEDPASLHKYSYAAEDPVDKVDPTGMDYDVGSLTIANGGDPLVGAQQILGGSRLSATEAHFFPSGKFQTTDTAAKDVYDIIIDRSIAEQKEYSSAIYSNPDATFSYTYPLGGGDLPATGNFPEGGRFCTPPDKIAIPKGTTLAAGFHTHGNNPHPEDSSRDCAACTFSQADMRIHDELKIPGYLGTPYNELKKYVPDPTRQQRGEIDLIYSGTRDPGVLRPAGTP